MRQLKISKSITNRDSPALERYLQEISKVDMITAEEEVVLARKIRNGDEAALLKLTKANLRFVVSVAKQYQNQGLTLNDLINEGNLGLIKAARRFDESRGFKFISYAVWWIRQSILQSLAEQSRLVRLPLNKVGLTNKISKTSNMLEQEFEREPDALELASELGMNVFEIENILNRQLRHTSLDAPLSDSEDGTLLDILQNINSANADQDLDHKESLKHEINKALNILTVKQRDVIQLFFGLAQDHPMSLEDIGLRLDLTRERVRQIKDKALEKLRIEKRCNILKDFLGN